MRISSLILLLMILFIGLNYQQSGIEGGDEIIDNLDWEEYNDEIVNLYENKTYDENNISNSIISIVGKVVDAGGYVVIETTKVVSGWVKDNSDWLNFELIFILVILSICASFIVPMFKLIVISVILVKEGIQGKRDKKELKQLRRKKHV